MPADQVRLDLDDSAIEELMDLARSASKLPQLVTLSEQAGCQIGTMAVAKQIAEKVEVSVQEARRLLVAILNYYHTQVRLKLSTEETAEAITNNLKRIAKTAENRDKSKAWEQGRPQIVEAVKQIHPDHPLELSYKSYRIATAREYELVGIKILTDVRPVFNEAGDKIVQTVISHVLSLDYHDGHHHRVIQFNLDAADVLDLKEMCERAAQKAGIIKRDLRKAPWPTTIFREPPDQRTTDL